MCGIVGILNFDNKEGLINRTTLEQMIGFIRHRGPDQMGIYIDKDIGLGHCRLSIIDLEGGQQPIYNEDKSIYIIYNGETFNYLELKENLLSKGHRFYTKTDTEVLIHLYEEKGPDFVKDLNGQFAFAIWDKNKNILLLARDRVGIRPLYYVELNDAIIFASEVKSFLALKDINLELDFLGLDQFFTFWTTIPPRTIFKNIKEIPPAHYLIITKNNKLYTKYWLPEFYSVGNKDLEQNKFKNYAEGLLELINDACRLRLRADVPVSAYLSGGLDSSFISSLIKRFYNDKLETFSVGFVDKEYDERNFQDIVANYINTKHHSVECKYQDICEVIPNVVWHAEKPLIRTAPAPLYILSKTVRDSGIKVVLTGEGSDEILGGYDIFKEMMIRRFWARNPNSKFRSSLFKRIYGYVQNWPTKRAPAFLEAFYKSRLNETDLPYYSHIPRWDTTSYTKLFFSDEIKQELKGYNAIEEYISTLPEEFYKWDYLSQAQYIEITTLLSGNLLSSQGDRVMMAHSVEGRLPFLDYRVIEYCIKIPPRFKINGLNEKYILKHIARPFLPKDIVDRTKQAYRAPDSVSFFYEQHPKYVDEILSEDYLKKCKYFNTTAVLNLVKKCKKSPNSLISLRDNIAIVGIITTLLLDLMFLKKENIENITAYFRK